VRALPSRPCRSHQSNIGFIAAICRAVGESPGVKGDASKGGWSETQTVQVKACPTDCCLVSNV